MQLPLQFIGLLSSFRKLLLFAVQEVLDLIIFFEGGLHGLLQLFDLSAASQQVRRAAERTAGHRAAGSEALTLKGDDIQCLPVFSRDGKRVIDGICDECAPEEIPRNPAVRFIHSNQLTGYAERARLL